MEKFYLLVYGCQMNAAEGEAIRKALLREKYIETDDMKEADLIILHTCCVRENAEEKIYGKIGEIKNIKRNNENLVLGITGCMAQRLGEKLFKRAPFIDFILGTAELTELLATIDAAKSERNRLIKMDLTKREMLPVSANNYSVYIPIMTGCDNFCSYCIVPYVRGRERSREAEDVVKDAKEAVMSGAKEITLLGQNVNSYGKDLGKNLDFSDLLKMIDEVEGICRIRFMTSHPKDLSDKLIETMASGAHIQPHLHLPVQHASNRILKLMNRNYTTEHYLNILAKLRASVKNIAVTTDLIVGFPTETEEDFAELPDFLDAAQLDAAYTFIYSKRSGTPAADMDGQITDEVKHDRLNRLMDKQNEISRRINETLKNKELDILVEGASKNDNVYQGRTDTNKLVLFAHGDEKAGDIVKVRVTEPQTWLLKGERI